METNNTETTITQLFLSGNDLEIQDYVFKKMAAIDTILRACQKENDAVLKLNRFQAFIHKAHKKLALINKNTLEAVELLSRQTSAMFDVMVRLSLGNLTLSQTIAEGLVKHSQAIQLDVQFSEKFRNHYSDSAKNFKKLIEEQVRAYQKRLDDDKQLDERLAKLENDNRELLRKYAKLEADTLARFGLSVEEAGSFTGKARLAAKKMSLLVKKPVFKYILLPAFALLVLYVLAATFFPPFVNAFFKAR